VSKTSQLAAGGLIIRDWTGRFIQAVAFHLGAASVLVVEAKTMCKWIRAIVQAIFTNIYIEGDNHILIQAVKRKIRVLWEIQVLLQDITTFLD